MTYYYKNIGNIERRAGGVCSHIGPGEIFESKKELNEYWAELVENQKEAKRMFSEPEEEKIEESEEVEVNSQEVKQKTKENKKWQQ